MTTQAELLERAELLSWPPVVAGGSPVTSAAQWRQVCASPGLHSTLAAQLDALEAEAARNAEQRDRWAAEDARRDAQREPDPDLIAREAAEARAAYEEFERKRPARVEEKLDAIAASLRTIADGLVRR